MSLINGTLQVDNSTDEMRGTFGSYGVLPIVSDLSGYVPYTGATSDVNLGTHALSTATLKLTNGAGTATITGAASNQTIAFPALSGTVPIFASTPVNAGIVGWSGTSGALTNITALPSGTTATTQSAGDNSTKVATTAYVDAAVPAISFGTFGSTPNANGGSYSGGVITLQPASASFPGGVTTGTQTFAGVKTVDSRFQFGATGEVFRANAATTQSAWGSFINSGGQGRIGVNGTTPGDIYPGALANEMVLGSSTSLAFFTGTAGRVASFANVGGAMTITSLTNGLVKSTSGVLSNATAGTDYLTPSGSGASLTGVLYTGSTTQYRTGHLYLQGDGNDTALSSPAFGWTNTADNRRRVFQLDGDNDIRLFYYNGTSWVLNTIFGYDGSLYAAGGIGGTTGTFTSSVGITGALTGTSATFNGGKLRLSDDGTYGSGYSTISFGGTSVNGDNRIFVGNDNSDDIYIAAGTGRGVKIWTNGSSEVAADFTSTLITFNKALTGTTATFSSTGAFLQNTGATTSNKYINIQNTSGGIVMGAENSAGGSLIIGNPAYYGALYGKAGLSLSADNGANVHLTINPSGNTTLSGTLGINGVANNVTSGTYTPTVTGITNFQSSSAYPLQYMRVGNVVTVSGELAIDATAAGVVEFRIDLPIASNLANSYELGGAGVFDFTGNYPTVIKGDAANNAAKFIYTTVGVSTYQLSFSFTYQVL